MSGSVFASREAAEQFRAVALHVKAALLAFNERDAFDPTPCLGDATEAAS